MCGIAGVAGLPLDHAVTIVERMCEHLRPRGPDDGGIQSFGEAVTLGSRRLAIIDPTPAGRQPMIDSERKTALVYNGMLYNFRALRKELEGQGERFLSSCDTEVVLRAYGVWGADFLSRLHGMFALALWDGRSEELLLARDHFGIKPLYFSHRAGSLAFASQVKTLIAGGAVEPTISPDGLQSFLAFGAVSEPKTILEGVEAVPAGHVARFGEGSLTVRPYWQSAHPEERPFKDPVEELRERLEVTMAEHLTSDVPIGVFLSGGLDSSLLAAVAARTSADVHTVSIEFDEPEFSERHFADIVARHIGSTHSSVVLTAQDMLGWLPQAFEAMDQPSFDGVNTYAVSRAAAGTGLKVAVSGLGADELFDGYGFVKRVRMLERLRRIPRPVARKLIKLARRDPSQTRKLSYWVDRGEAGTEYELLRSLFLPDEVSALLGRSEDAGFSVPSFSPDRDPYRELSDLDLMHYTRNVLLRDTDAMSMANSLEVRVPYLADEFSGFALALPAEAKGERKRLLSDAARGLVPEEILRRPKHGFLVPFNHWLRHQLADDVRAAFEEPPSALASMIDVSVLPQILYSYHMGQSSWLRPWALYALTKWLNDVSAISASPQLAQVG